MAAFNKDAYRDGYLKPKSRLKLTALQDDLFERYAITLPASDSDIARTLKEVRSFWGIQQAGTPQAKYAKMLIAADEELKLSRVESGPNRGRDMNSAAWWEEKRAAQDVAAQERVAKLANLLKDQNGAYGVVTRSFLTTCAERLSLNAAKAEQAAKTIGLEIVDGVKLPDHPPIGQYSSLENELGVGGVATIPELVHPGSAPFRIVERFESTSVPSARLDVDGVRSQEIEANRQGTSATWNARRKALNLLRSAAESGADIRQIALYHLAQSAMGSGVPGAAGIKAELRSRGVEERDANILAVVLAERGGGGPSGAGHVEQLLQEGRLNEAVAVAQRLPQDGVNVKQLLARIETAQAKLRGLRDDVQKLLAVPDEQGALAKVKQLAAISGEDADELMALVPLTPARDVRIDVDGRNVRLHWQPNVGHDADTTYRVVRSLDGPPLRPANGSPVEGISGTSASDGNAPVAQSVHYSVFASAPGRPSSRPASADTILLPPVQDARMEAGQDWVSAHWSAHPGAHHVEAVRRDGRNATPVPVRLDNAKLEGLPEGISVHVELTAVYERPEGGILRSASVTVAGTPRAAATPLENLRAQPVGSAGGVQVRLSWTPVDKSGIRLKRSNSAPRWATGETVGADEMSAWGDDVTGPTDTLLGQTRLTASLPAGVHYVVPFSVGGIGVVVGRAVTVGVTDPVVGLTATPFQGYARLAWTWPGTSSLAEVTWERDDTEPDSAGVKKISRAEYDSGGATVPLGAAPCKVSVRAMMIVDGQYFFSPPVTTTIEQVSGAPVAYDVASSAGIGPLGRRTKKLTLSSSVDTGPLRIAFVASRGIVMPADPEEGLTMLDETLTLLAGRPQTFTAKVPSAFSRPYWVRAFLISGNAQLQDPPLTKLKEG